MRKILCFGLALILSLGLISCDEYLTTSSDNVVIQPDIVTSSVAEISSIEEVSSVLEVSSMQEVSSEEISSVIEVSSEVVSSKEEVSSEAVSSKETVSSKEEVSSQVTSSKETATQNVEKMVWIPQSGKKYHSNSACSGMKNPTEVTVEKAVNLGFTPCKKCY